MEISTTLEFMKEQPFTLRVSGHEDQGAELSAITDKYPALRKIGKPQVSVVIPVMADKPYSCMRTISSILGQSGLGSLTPTEVVLVVNSSNPKDVKNACSILSPTGIEIVQLISTRSYPTIVMQAEARGFDKASGDLVLVTHTDTVVSPTWVSAHVAVLKRASISYGAVFYPKTPPEKQTFDTHAIEVVGHGVRLVKVVLGKSPAKANNIGMHKDAFNNINPYEELLRLRDAGKKVTEQGIPDLFRLNAAFVPGAQVVEDNNGWIQRGDTLLSYLRHAVRSNFDNNSYRT